MALERRVVVTGLGAVTPQDLLPVRNTTGIVNGYTVEGHVPAADIQRLLREKPKAKGLAVPGMPMGSPGMEGPRNDAYSVVQFDSTGGTSIYQKYPHN